MNYSKQEADRLLERLERHLDKDPDFSESDRAALHEMAQAWRGWVSLGRGAKWIITVLGLIAAAVASWGVLAGVIKDWLRS
jgi:hypothetical protein